MPRRKIIPYRSYLVLLAKVLRKNMTKAEASLWNQLKRKQIQSYDFDRQRPIDNYIVDFYCKELQLAIEIDGNTHDHPDQSVDDVERQKRLESLGVTVIRFTDQDVLRDMDYVIRAIEVTMEELEIKK